MASALVARRHYRYDFFKYKAFPFPFSLFFFVKNNSGSINHIKL